jgi:hypothetical protein
MEKTITVEKEILITDYEDRLSSYESQFYEYRTWLDEDAQASLVLVASIEDQFSADIVELEWTHQTLTFLHSRYEPTGQYTFLTVIHQKQHLYCLFDQLSVVWCQINTLDPQLSPATCHSCKDCHLSVIQRSGDCTQKNKVMWNKANKVGNDPTLHILGLDTPQSVVKHSYQSYLAFLAHHIWE